MQSSSRLVCGVRGNDNKNKFDLFDFGKKRTLWEKGFETETADFMYFREFFNSSLTVFRTFLCYVGHFKAAIKEV